MCAGKQASVGTENRALPAENRRSGVLGRFLGFVGWMVPSALLALIPKCPACVVGYAVVGTSVGTSLAGLAQFRLLLVIVSIASLSYLAIKGASWVLWRSVRRS